LNDTQVRLIAEAFPKRDYYLQSRAGNRLFELGLGPVALALVAASSPEDQRTVDAVLSRSGPHHFAKRYLAERDLHWAANLISTFEQAQKA
jgi:type IV secretion system protein VirB4